MYQASLGNGPPEDGRELFDDVHERNLRRWAFEGAKAHLHLSSVPKTETKTRSKMKQGESESPRTQDTELGAWRGACVLEANKNRTDSRSVAGRFRVETSREAFRAADSQLHAASKRRQTQA